MNANNEAAITMLETSLASDIAQAIARAGTYVLKLNRLLRDGIAAGAKPAAIVAALNPMIQTAAPEAVEAAVRTAWYGLAPACCAKGNGHNPIIAAAFDGCKLAYNKQEHLVELVKIKARAPQRDFVAEACAMLGIEKDGEAMLAALAMLQSVSAPAFVADQSRKAG